MQLKAIGRFGIAAIWLSCFLFFSFHLVFASQLNHISLLKNKSLSENQADASVFYRAFPGFQAKPITSQVESYDYLNQQLTGWPVLNPLGVSVTVGEKTLVIKDFKIVPGFQVAAAFAPATEQMQEIKTSLSYVGDDWNQVFIPPDSSLVMVKVNVQPESSGSCMDFRSYRWTISYPNFPATEAWYFSKNERLGNYPTADTNCLTSGWLYFYLPTLTVDPEQVWIMVDAHIPGMHSLGIWKLSQKP